MSAKFETPLHLLVEYDDGEFARSRSLVADERARLLGSMIPEIPPLWIVFGEKTGRNRDALNKCAR
jgi:hypothetical protein